MKALLKNNFSYDKDRREFNGKWVEIDTKCLFDNQYNTTEEFGNMRIFDGDIVAIKDDVRIGKGKCKYCGAIVEHGHEEEHFLEKEALKAKCSMKELETKSCFWKSKGYIGERIVHREMKEEEVDGVMTAIEVQTIEQKWEPYCSHEEKYGGCTYEQCRKHGIEWFTEKNCFFIKYPNGYGDFNLADWVKGSWHPRWSDSETLFINQSYQRMLGSYTLQMEISSDKKHIINFTLENARNRFRFLYKDGEYIVFDGINNSPRTTKNLLEEGGTNPKCNTTVNKAVRMAVEGIIKREREVC